MERVLVGIDGSEGSRHALRWAAAEARQWGAELAVLNVWSFAAQAAGPGYGTLPAASDLQAAQEDLCRRVLAEEGLDRETGDPPVALEVVEGPTVPELLRAAADADLLVLGARGVGGFVGLLVGSVSQHCAAHAPGPVVIVHAPDRD
ncbi:MAG: universal stress protein [Acidimicrobiia bacterium]|nr:universal stress protein [Acidimicrobiia bacterium]